MLGERVSRGAMVVAVVVGLFVFAVARVGSRQALPSDPQRLQEMRHHFLQVTLIYEAVIRGDVAAVRAPATELAALPTPPGVPPAGAPFVEAVRDAARRAMVATTLNDVAAPVGTMLAQCGQCHRTMGVFPGASARAYPDVGGIVGHMLNHQRAVDEMLQGLLIPSDSHWSQGAERLRTAELSRADLPPDPQLTPELRRAEAAVHALADRAANASTATDRAAVYVELATTCAQCHSLHRRIWGPRTPGN